MSNELKVLVVGSYATPHVCNMTLSTALPQDPPERTRSKFNSKQN